MDAIIKRIELQNYIKNADDKEIEYLYTVFLNKVLEPYEWWNDEEMMAELERRSAALKSGEDKGFTLEESMAQLTARINKSKT